MNTYARNEDSFHPSFCYSVTTSIPELSLWSFWDSFAGIRMENSLVFALFGDSSSSSLAGSSQSLFVFFSRVSLFLAHAGAASSSICFASGGCSWLNLVAPISSSFGICWVFSSCFHLGRVGSGCLAHRLCWLSTSRFRYEGMTAWARVAQSPVAPKQRLSLCRY